jgi:hypothetical protein
MVGLEQTVRGESVETQWKCRSCEAEWPTPESSGLEPHGGDRQRQ